MKLLYPENFDDCGMVVPTERGSVCLGDGTVRPSDYWGSGEDGALNFLNDETGGKPPHFADSDTEKFQVVVSNFIFELFYIFNIFFFFSHIFFYRLIEVIVIHVIVYHQDINS